MVSNHYEQLYQPLVGTAAAVQGFEARLTDTVRRASDVPEAYDLLEVGMWKEIFQANATTMSADSSLLQDRAMVQKDTANAGTGTSATVNALRAVGSVYQAESGDVPQREANVRISTNKMLLHVLTLSLLTPIRSLTATDLLERGANPANRFELARSWVKAFGVLAIVLAEPANRFDKSLVASKDAHGQVSVDLRYPVLRPDNPERGCPAAKAKISTEQGDNQSGLRLVMRSVGNVAMQEIFPQQFTIAPAVE